jgi:hypothetical protein
MFRFGGIRGRVMGGWILESSDDVGFGSSPCVSSPGVVLCYGGGGTTTESRAATSWGSL